MANELNIALSSGLTVTAQRYQAGAAVGSAISLTEVGSSGFYTGDMTGTAGTYQLAFLAAGATVGSGQIVWDGTNEIATSTLTAPQVRTELSTELGRIDANISSRLAASAYTAPSAAPTAAANASAVWSAATRTLTSAAGITASDVWSHATRTLTSASGPTASEIRTEIDANSTQLAAIKAKTDNLPASPAATGDIPSANITAIKAKTDALNTDRLAQCSTVSTTGAQLAAALS